MAENETVEGIPWNPSIKVPMIRGVEAWLRATLPPQQHAFVPASVVAMREPAVEARQVTALLDALRGFLHEEFSRWTARAERFVALGLYRAGEIEPLIEARADAHPWALCATERGGLGPFERNAIPCIAVKNHAIAWLPTDQPAASVSYLVTARAHGEPWDMNDLGHECGHASPFPLALCAQDGGVLDELPATTDPALLGANHLRKIHYTMAEGANAVVRGEARATATGFAVLHSKDELLGFLRWGERLFPGLGFDEAHRAYEAWPDAMIPMDQPVAFQVGAPFLRANRLLAPSLRRLGPPDLSWLPAR